MKKTFALVCLSLLGVTAAFAAGKPASKADVSAAVNAKVANALQNNNGAIKNNLRVDFRITEYVTRYVEDGVVFPSEDEPQNGRIQKGPYEADLACKAYALDSNWLILSGTCMRYSPDPVQIYEPTYYERDGREIDSDFSVGNYSIPAKNYAYNDDVMLLWTGDANTAKFLSELPKVNVLAVSSPNKLFALNDVNTFKINTARLGTNAIRERKLKTNSIKGNMLQLEEGATDLSGTATDPLFLVTPSGREFLAGYNDGILGYALQITFNDIVNTFDGRTSKDYFTLSEKDLNFIKKTVLEQRPGDWKRIKNRLFLDQTATPYFK